jgi:hypothetical protein
VGGVSERTITKAGGIKPSARSGFLQVGAVKGILVLGKAALFAEWRRNEGLDRSVSVQRYPPLQTGAPVTADVRRLPRRGTPSACATKRVHPTRPREIGACARGGVLRSVLRLVYVNPHYTPVEQSLGGGAAFQVSAMGKLAQAGGTINGAWRSDDTRLAASHRLRKERA